MLAVPHDVVSAAEQHEIPDLMCSAVGAGAEVVDVAERGWVAAAFGGAAAVAGGDGPPSNVVPLRIEREIQRWSEARAAAATAVDAGTSGLGGEAQDTAARRTAPRTRLTRWLSLVRQKFQRP